MNQVENEENQCAEVEPIDIIDAVQRMPENERQETMVSLEMHYGPIPHPTILKAYDDMAEGSAKLIIENGVAESKHRREMEKAILRKEVNDKKRGHYLGFLIGSLVIVLGFWLIMNDHTIAGSALTGITVLGLVGSFTGGSDSRSNSDENQETE